MATLLRPDILPIVVIVAIVLECAILMAISHRSARVRPIDVFAVLLPGLFLVLALRSALAGDGMNAVALWLALSLVAHLFDLYRRFR